MISEDVRKTVSFFKRFRMECALGDLPPLPDLPSGYALIPWSDSLLEAHAEVKFHCFQGEIDAVVFPSLSTRAGCLKLMREISQRPGFRASSTWLAICDSGFCGTVQGVRVRSGVGAIQNLGIVPNQRGRGLGAALLLKALHGFRDNGLKTASLEVTAQNDAAVQLYRRLGFRRRRTLYRAVDAFSALGEPPISPSWYL